MAKFLDGISIPQERVFYYPGVSLEGSEACLLIDQALNDLCRGLPEGAFDAVYVTGLSRGAIQAVTFVNRAEKRCQRKIPFSWVGLVDPVNTTIENLPTTMPGAAEIPCVLIRKRIKFEHIFTTKMIGLCNTLVINVPDIGHAAISFDEDVANAMKLSARDLGQKSLKLFYNPSSALYRPVVGEDSESLRCASFQGFTQECLAAKCEYDLQSGLCKPLKKIK